MGSEVVAEERKEGLQATALEADLAGAEGSCFLAREQRQFKSGSDRFKRFAGEIEPDLSDQAKGSFDKKSWEGEILRRSEGWRRSLRPGPR